MDYKKAQRDYNFKRFGKTGAIYKVLNGDKILLIKKVSTSANNLLQDLVGFSVVNFDQIETKGENSKLKKR